MTEIVELESSKAAACLLLPQLPGVDIYSFTISDTDTYSSPCGAGDQLNSNRSGNAMNALDEDDMKQFSDADIDHITKIPLEKKVRAVLLFFTEASVTDTEFGRSLVRRYGANNTLVAGGFADRLVTGSADSQ